MKPLKHCPLCRRGNFDLSSATTTARCDWCGNEESIEHLDVDAIHRIEASKTVRQPRVEKAWDISETVFQLWCAHAKDGESLNKFYERVWTEFDVMEFYEERRREK